MGLKNGNPYRRERRVRKPQPRIRWTKGQLKKLEDSVSRWNKMVDDMLESGKYARIDDSGKRHENVPRKIDYEYEKQRIGSAIELRDFTRMVNDITDIDPTADPATRNQIPYNPQFDEKVEKYLEKERAKRWNRRMNVAEERGYQSWDEMPPDVQRTILSKDSTLDYRENRRNAADVDLSDLTDRKWYTDVAYMQNYLDALRDNNYPTDLIGYIDNVMSKILDVEEAGTLRKVFEDNAISPAFDIAYLYRAKPDSTKGNPYKDDFSTKVGNIRKFWKGIAREYDLDIEDGQELVKHTPRKSMSHGGGVVGPAQAISVTEEVVKRSEGSGVVSFDVIESGGK